MHKGYNHVLQKQEKYERISKITGDSCIVMHPLHRAKIAMEYLTKQLT